MPRLLEAKSVEMAVQIAVAAVPVGGGSYISEPGKVAEFLEVVARKLDELRYGAERQP
jgi:hypothetical protein